MTIWLFGSAMIFMLARVLGGDVNYSQCLGVIGYSVLPLFLVGLVLPLTHSLYLLHNAIKVRVSSVFCFQASPRTFDLLFGNSCIE